MKTIKHAKILVFLFYIPQLAQAKQVFSQIARGPACEKYMKQLEESCDRFWKNGRQLCEEVSLLGNHCVNPVHTFLFSNKKCLILKEPIIIVADDKFCDYF